MIYYVLKIFIMIKYQYAKDENGTLININSITEINRNQSNFFCIGCGNEVIAKLGKIKIHHFSHKTNISCSGETYLHLLGKKLFYDNYINCLEKKLPFFIENIENKYCNHFESELGNKCKQNDSTIQFDLTKFFDNILIEKREGSFIPDLMLTNNLRKDKIFIEIAVTHKSSEEKVNSKNRIIEILVENESDLSPIKNKILSINDSKIKFINFKNSKTVKSHCLGICNKQYNFITLDKDGRCLLNQRNLTQIKNFLDYSKDNIIDYKILELVNYNYRNIYQKAIASYIQDNIKVRNCFVCRYHTDNDSTFSILKNYDKTIFCKFLKKTCNSNEAVSCKSFIIENRYVQIILDRE